HVSSLNETESWPEILLNLANSYLAEVFVVRVLHRESIRLVSVRYTFVLASEPICIENQILTSHKTRRRQPYVRAVGRARYRSNWMTAGHDRPDVGLPQDVPLESTDEEVLFRHRG